MRNISWPQASNLDALCRVFFRENGLGGLESWRSSWKWLRPQNLTVFMAFLFVKTTQASNLDALLRGVFFSWKRLRPQILTLFKAVFLLKCLGSLANYPTVNVKCRPHWWTKLGLRRPCKFSVFVVTSYGQPKQIVSRTHFDRRLKK